MKISFLTWGPDNGKPILVFHGFPGSAHDATGFGLWAEKFGAKVWAFDRPGYGETDYSFRDDIQLYFRQILKDLPPGEKLTIIGISGGGPYATDFVVNFPERVDKLILICAVAGLKHPESLNAFPLRARAALRLFSKLPTPLQESIFWVIHKSRRTPERFLKKFASTLPPVDQEMFRDDRVSGTMSSTFGRAGEQRLLGAAADLSFYLQWDPPKDFPKDIPTFIFHGTMDTIVPFVNSKIFREHLPNHKFKSWEEGHFSLPIKRLEEIMKIASEAV